MTCSGPQASPPPPGSPPVRDLFRSFVADGDLVPLCLSVHAAALFLVLLGSCIASWYHPETGPLVQAAKALLTATAGTSVKPEPVERLQYLLGLVCTPAFLLAVLWLLRSYYQRAAARPRRILSYLATLLLVEGTLAVPICVYESLKRSDFLYVRASVLHTHFVVYVLLIFPVLAGLAFLADRRWVAVAAKWVVYAVSAYLAVVVFLSALLNRETMLPWAAHIDPVLYPLAQVHAGKTLLVNCAPLYGLYPHFLQPLFAVIPLSVYYFTGVMALLLVASLSAQWLFLRSLTNNPIVFLCGISAAAFFPHLTTRLVTLDPYFQYWPIRVLFPSLILVLSSLYLRGRSSRLTYYAAFLCASLAILWNPDSGAVVFGAWVLLLGYHELFRGCWRSALRPFARHAATAMGSLLLVFAAYAIFARLRSGTWPSLRMSSSYYELFSHYGYYMLPMPDLPHVWGLTVGIYLLALAIALSGLLSRRDEAFHGSLFLLAVLGGGLFGYYNGRSHDNCAIFGLYLPVLIVTLLVDRLLAALKRNPAHVRLLPLACLLFFFPASALPSLFSPDNLGQLKELSLAGIRASRHDRQGRSSLDIDFIKGLTKPGEGIFILVKDWLEGPYYAESATRSALDLPSSIDWFFKRDHAEIERFLRENRSVKVFAIPGQFREYTKLLQGYRVVASQAKSGLTLYLPK
jgi:hypothetical protein